MKDYEATVGLIKRNACPGLSFRSGTCFYTITILTELSVAIIYFDSIEEIPSALFYQVMRQENSDLLINWKDNEGSVSIGDADYLL